MQYSFDTKISDLLADPKAKEALYRVFPGELERGFLEKVGHLSFSFIENFAPGKLRDEELAAVKRELEALNNEE